MTNDYIRRQDVVDTINTNADGLEQNGGIPYAQGARAMAIVVEQMSPADVAPVVRCKDCHCHGTCTHEQYLGLDGFCSHGERREE